MPSAARYTVRRNAFERERTWFIDDAGLGWTAEDMNGHCSFGEISAIRFEWAVNRANSARHACHVIRLNGWTETIVSTTYAGPMNFPDQAAGYVPFCRELVRRTAEGNPGCRFEAGATALRWFASIAVLVLGLLVVALVLFTTGLPLTVLIVAKLVLLALLAPLAINWIRKNRPRRFQPADIPQDVLPPLTADSPSQKR